MSKGLEALDNIKVSLAEYKEYAIEKMPTKAKQIREENDDNLDTIETALKALEIIKENCDFSFEIRRILDKELYRVSLSCNINKTTIYVDKEEYDLLKEVLQ